MTHLVPPRMRRRDAIAHQQRVRGRGGGWVGEEGQHGVVFPGVERRLWEVGLDYKAGGESAGVWGTQGPTVAAVAVVSAAVVAVATVAAPHTGTHTHTHVGPTLITRPSSLLTCACFTSACLPPPAAAIVEAGTSSRSSLSSLAQSIDRSILSYRIEPANSVLSVGGWVSRAQGMPPPQPPLHCLVAKELVDR